MTSLSALKFTSAKIAIDYQLVAKQRLCFVYTPFCHATTKKRLFYQKLLKYPKAPVKA